MAIVMVWAPANNIHCLFLFGLRASGALEVPSYLFVGCYLILQFGFACFAVISAVAQASACWRSRAKHCIWRAPLRRSRRPLHAQGQAR